MAVTLTSLLWPNGSRLASPGPFEDSSGNLWAVGFSSADNELAAWRSTDAGASWAKQVVATGAGYSLALSLVAVQAGDVLYIAFLEGTGGVTRVWTFNMGTSAFARADSGTGPTPTNNVSGQPPLAFARRSDGSFVVFYNGPTVSNMGTAYRKVYYRIYSGGAWGTETRVDGTGSTAVHADARTAVLGSSDRAHLFYTTSDASGIKHKTLTSAGALQSEQANIASNNAAVGDNYSAGSPALAGSKVVLPYSNGANGLKEVYATSADTPTWSVATVEVVTPANAATNPAAAATDGTTVYILWSDGSTSDLWYEKESAANTWADASTEVQDAVTVQGVSAGYLAAANKVGYLFNDNGTVKFDKVSLAAATKAIVFQSRVGRNVLLRR